MSKYTFPIKGVHEAIAFSEDRGQKDILFAKDQGVYIFGKEAPTPKPEDVEPTVVASVEEVFTTRDPYCAANGSPLIYADGFDPNIVEFDDWWEGGDDFGEHLPVSLFYNAEGAAKRDNKRPPTKFVVTVGERYITVKCNGTKVTKAELSKAVRAVRVHRNDPTIQYGVAPDGYRLYSSAGGVKKDITKDVFGGLGQGISAVQFCKVLTTLGGVN